MSEDDSARALTMGDATIRPGRRGDVELKVSRLPTGTWVSLPVSVLHGRRPGPSVFVSAAIHGDELNGVEIVRRLLQDLDPRGLRGTVIAVPIANVLGFLHQDRYLPDRRDLNRCFPGSARGSLASRLAYLFLEEIVGRCQYGIDLHTGSNHRSNLPQLRVDLDDPRVRSMCEAFHPPVAIHARQRNGSLREVASERGCPVLVYEAGETLRFDRRSIQLGVRGVLRVLGSLGMIDDAPPPEKEPVRWARETKWARASRGGILLLEVQPGDVVTAGQRLARIGDTFNRKEQKVVAPIDGVVIGLTTNPLVNRGDAVVHVASC